MRTPRWTVFAPFLLAAMAEAAEIRPRVAPERWEPDPGLVSLDRSVAKQIVRLAARSAVSQTARRGPAIANVIELDEPVVVRTETWAGAGLSVAAKITADGASTLRLHVADVEPGVVLWVAGEGDESFERFEPGPKARWSPTTRGATVYIATEAGTHDFTLTSLAIGSAPQDVVPACVLDAACAANVPPELEEASRAIAKIHVVRGDSSHVCTGALLNDAANSGTGFLLTARHCVSTAEEAASIEVIWDDRATSCGSSGKRTTPRTYGAELLVSSADTDMALLRLTKVPPNRVFLGVSTADLPAGTKTYRLSHAGGAPQSFAFGAAIDDQGIGCVTAPRPQFLYTSQVQGAVASGSSGSPLLTAGLLVAGQLSGRCGGSPDDACSADNVLVDGSMQASWPILEPFLNAPSGSRRRHAARH